jgi:hypothetical protein
LFGHGFSLLELGQVIRVAVQVRRSSLSAKY